MRTKFSPFRFVFVTLCALTFLGLPARGQEKEEAKEEARVHQLGLPASGQEKEEAKVHQHSVQDWSRHHAVYPRFGPINRLIELQKDPRAIEAWQASFRKDFHRGWRQWHRNWGHNHTVTHADWSISLGAGSMAAATYPSKWTFDSNETVTGGRDASSCLNDYIAFTVDTAAGAGQPNIVGLNNLYSGTSGGADTGVCNGPLTGTDTGVDATQYFSYSVIGDDGIVSTSPTTSMLGDKIAFVEGSGTGLTASSHFHVLAWKALDGQNAGNLQDALTNSVQITAAGTGFTDPLAPAAGSGTSSDLDTGTIITLSSPYVEYSTDVAYFGDDFGELLRVQNVFCTTTACTGGGTPAPSPDPAFGAGGVVVLGGTCTGKVTSPVADGSAGNIFVGCADGKLYGFDWSGNPITGSPLTVGDGTALGGIVDPPVLDVVKGFVYVTTGRDASTHVPVVVQASVNTLATGVVATLGLGGATGGAFNMHAPAFNDAYFTSGTPATWLLYEYSADTSVPQSSIWGIGFNSSHVMIAGTPTNVDNFPGIGANEISPLTEFLTTGGEDRIFASALNNFAFNVADFRVDAGFPGTFENIASEASGTTGMVIDNIQSGAAESNSIYFGTLGGTAPNPNSAVKLTQGGLL